jgi:hypothetical protein
MKSKITTILSVVAALVTVLCITGPAEAGPPARPALQSGAPTVVSYQGRVTVGSTPYDGTGYFKFAIVDKDGTTTYWSNDGQEPTAGISLTVTAGLFNVLLGDTTLPNMTELYAEVFNDTECYLRVWFSVEEYGEYQWLDPDRRIAAVPYALQAQEAADADTVDSYEGAALEESSEIDADIATHAAIADAHHARYTDGEAWAAALANDGPGSGACSAG